MSGLLDEAMTPCRMIDKSTVKDGYGGFTHVWTDGAEFEAAIVKDDSTATRVAMSEGVAGNFTVTTRRNINLEYHDVFKVLDTGLILRVTTGAPHRLGTETPKSAGLNMRQVKAEEWSLVEDG